MTTDTPRTDEAFPHLIGKTLQELQDKVEECSGCGNQDDYANAMSNLSDYYVKEKFRQLELELTAAKHNIVCLMDVAGKRGNHMNSQAQYISFLEKESEKYAPTLYAHGIRYPQDDFEKGEALREAVKHTRACLPTKSKK
jgi:hypothetical protein